MATRPLSASLEVEIVCCDLAEHRRRVELREPDLADHELLSTWQTSWRATTTSGRSRSAPSWTPASEVIRRTTRDQSLAVASD